MARPLETWPGRWMMDAQALPVRLYQTADRIILAAPMPGLEPSNISISIADGRVTIDGGRAGAAPARAGSDAGRVGHWAITGDVPTRACSRHPR